MDFLHVTPDSDAFLTLDLPTVRRLADDATARSTGSGCARKRWATSCGR
jgi:hypothetical protein